MPTVPQEFVRKSIEKALGDLPALPSVVARVLVETESENPSISTIESMLAADQALASKVLRVVNSAYYGLSGQVTSLNQAIVILGLQQIRNLVLSVGAASALKPKTQRQQEVLKQFWLHSFAAAACGEIIAKRKNLSALDRETLFVAGLLHDIGRLFLFCNFTQTYDQVFQVAAQRSLVVEQVEIQLLGLNHGGIGGQMARQWNLPPLLVDLIETHEGPFSAEDDPKKFVLHFADNSSKHIYFPNNPPSEVPANEHAMAWLGFSEEDVRSLREETDKRIEEASGVFGLLAA